MLFLYPFKLCMSDGWAENELDLLPEADCIHSQL